MRGSEHADETMAVAAAEDRKLAAMPTCLMIPPAPGFLHDEEERSLCARDASPVSWPSGRGGSFAVADEGRRCGGGGGGGGGGGEEEEEEVLSRSKSWLRTKERLIPSPITCPMLQIAKFATP